jgi:hypothetical protein
VKEWAGQATPSAANALHAENFGLNSRSGIDSRVAIWFDSPLALNRNNEPEGSGFGRSPCR